MRTIVTRALALLILVSVALPAHAGSRGRVSGNGTVMPSVTAGSGTFTTLTSGTGAFSGRVQLAKGADTSVANILTLPAGGNFFTITGNSPELQRITHTGWAAGSRVTLQFSGTPLIKHASSESAGNSNITFPLAADYQCAAGDTIVVEFDGTTWLATGTPNKGASTVTCSQSPCIDLVTHTMTSAFGQVINGAELGLLDGLNPAEAILQNNGIGALDTLDVTTLAHVLGTLNVADAVVVDAAQLASQVPVTLGPTNDSVILDPAGTVTATGAVTSGGLNVTDTGTGLNFSVSGAGMIASGDLTVTQQLIAGSLYTTGNVESIGGHMAASMGFYGISATPALTDCSGGSATITGGTWAGHVDQANGNTCTVTFEAGTTGAAAGVECSVTPRSAGAVGIYITAQSTAAFTVTGASLSGDSFSWTCGQH